MFCYFYCCAYCHPHLHESDGLRHNPPPQGGGSFIPLTPTLSPHRGSGRFAKGEGVICVDSPIMGEEGIYSTSRLMGRATTNVDGEGIQFNMYNPSFRKSIFLFDLISSNSLSNCCWSFLSRTIPGLFVSSTT